jgi:glycosyltransferase involved in cell wall biosynthesis
MTRKTKILMLSDHPLSTSGVGVQARYLIQGLIATGKYSFRCFGGAVKHDNYDTLKVNDDFVIKPTNGFGDKNLLRMTLAVERPDVLLLFTDPRFFIWVWEMEDEIHQVCPIAYNHLWDGPPWPEYNRVLYESTDLVNCINYPTYDMVRQRFPEKTNYIPHAVPKEIFHPISAEESLRLRERVLGKERLDHFVVTYVSRNARRKMPSDVIISFKQFLTALEAKEGHRKASLVMHTDPLDPEGPNLHHVIDMLHLKEHVIFSKDRIGFPEMNSLYAISDTVVNRSCFPAGTNVASSEGFKHIEDVRVGDLVMSHTGQLRRVVDTMTKPYTGTMRHLIVTNNDPIDCTDEHPIWAIKRTKLQNTLKSILGNPKGLIRDHVTKAMVDELVEFVPAMQLEKGDFCVYAARQDDELPVPSFDLTRYIDATSHAQQEVINGNIVLKNTTRQGNNTALCTPASVKLTPALAYVMGNWIADGTTNGFSVAFNTKDEAKMIMLERMLAEAFNGIASHRFKSGRNCTLINPVNGAIISRFVNDVYGAYSSGKHAPTFMFTASKKVKQAFIAGLMAGDGCVLTHPQQGTKMSRYRTISSQLALELKDLLASLGYCVSMSYDDNSSGYNKTGKIWCLEWRDRTNGYNGSCHSWNVEGTYILETVTSVESVEVSDVPVYNLEVETDNTYRLQGLTVHNCNEGFGLPTLEMMMTGKPIIALKTGGLTRQVEDHETGEQYGIGLEPEVRTLVGNQMVPYIYEDFVSHETVAKAFMQLYEMGPEKRAELGKRAMAHAHKDYDIERLIGDWDTSLTKLTGEWNSGKKPARWEKVEI